MRSNSIWPRESEQEFGDLTRRSKLGNMTRDNINRVLDQSALKQAILELRSQRKVQKLAFKWLTMSWRKKIRDNLLWKLRKFEEKWNWFIPAGGFYNLTTVLKKFLPYAISLLAFSDKSTLTRPLLRRVLNRCLKITDAGLKSEEPWIIRLSWDSILRILSFCFSYNFPEILSNWRFSEKLLNTRWSLWNAWFFSFFFGWDTLSVFPSLFKLLHLVSISD